MATIRLPTDFAEFLRSLRSSGVEDLLVGGRAVGLYGCPRATTEVDVWVRRSPQNTDRVVAVIRDFGKDLEDLRHLP